MRKMNSTRLTNQVHTPVTFVGVKRSWDLQKQLSERALELWSGPSGRTRKVGC